MKIYAHAMSSFYPIFICTIWKSNEALNLYLIRTSPPSLEFPPVPSEATVCCVPTRHQ